jgi:hypothetical protein
MSSIEVETLIAVALLVASLSAANARCASEGSRIKYNSNSPLDRVASLVKF